ncbi:hypothetical protein N665_0190s0025 [Sinapis alba]|nr:hypothetical protein N665_0190s0025 [Sinapis alba]
MKKSKKKDVTEMIWMITDKKGISSEASRNHPSKKRKGSWILGSTKYVSICTIFGIWVMNCFALYMK